MDDFRLRNGDQGRRPCMREQSCLQTTESRRHAAGGPGPPSRPLIKTPEGESRPFNVETWWKIDDKWRIKRQVERGRKSSSSSQDLSYL